MSVGIGAANRTLGGRKLYMKTKTWMARGIAISALSIGVSVFLSPSSAVAISVYTLAPGTGMTAQSSSFPAGSPSYAISSTFATATLAGTVYSSVYENDTSNPYGGLTFAYQVLVTASSTDSSSEMTVGSFANFFTDVSYNPLAGGLIAPSNFSRSASGNVVRFVFFNAPVGPGQTSALLVVQTDAASYQQSTAAVIDNLSANVTSLAPVATVPEPSMVTLLLGGLGLLGVVLRRKS